ncbi:3-oxoacyl-ACP synthase [Pseudonocardia sp. K10HN5]|uniref:3-oxoacyl-ACP synthase n=2 Tax=Pseudonocardia acidicola TaxID=2724939 RepID=A0ABX1SA63_9PSEU|nr:3-oxoacyl-ACP synthase [Pseudonocardia acidicola]
MALEGGTGGSPEGRAYRSRFAGIGARLPERRLTTEELMASTRYDTGIELERLTGVRERHVVAAGEDSYTLALAAAQDALAHAGCEAQDLDMLIVSSISRHVGGMRIQLEPPVSVRLKHVLGADRALSFDLSNACAGMMTGVFLLNDLVRQGRIRRGMVVSGEYISELGRNAAEEVRDVTSDQLASLTLGDAGAAAIVERAPDGAPGIDVAGFTTLSGHSRLCVAFPATIGPGTTMHTQAREIHAAGIAEAVPRLREVLDAAGLAMDDVDYLIMHQTSTRAIAKGAAAVTAEFGAAPKHMVVTVDELGNTASTTHFVALWKYLNEGRFRGEDRILLLALASGLEVGIVIFTVGQLVERYGQLVGSHGYRD